MPSKLKGDSTAAIATDTNHEHNHESDQPELTWAACLWRDQEARDGVAKIWIQIYCVHIPGFFLPWHLKRPSFWEEVEFIWNGL